MIDAAAQLRAAAGVVSYGEALVRTTALGWCPGLNTADFMVKAYPGTTAARIFRSPTQDLPAWDSPTLAPLVAQNIDIHLSVKKYDLAAADQWATAMPATYRGRLLWTIHHEPEQQSGGDPTPAVFKSRWLEFAKRMETHPNRHRMLLGPVFTLYWWEANPGNETYLPVDAMQYLDFIGWDIYNSTWLNKYVAPSTRLELPQKYAEKTGKRITIAEWGCERIAADPSGTGAVQWMKDFVTAARAVNAINACWFHKDGCDLIGRGRTVEQETLRQLIAGAVDYEAGYNRAYTEGYGVGYADAKRKATSAVQAI